jgi:DNA-binding response OmpR family regulator
VEDNRSGIFASVYQISSHGENERSLFLAQQADHALPRTNVLVVEQNPSIQDMLCWAMELAGYRAIARSPDDIVRQWSDHQRLASEEIALLLLDLSFPWDRDGITFLRSLRAHPTSHPGVTPPIIVLTTSEQIYWELSRQGEFVEKKPFHITHLLARIETLLAQSRPDDTHIT